MSYNNIPYGRSTEDVNIIIEIPAYSDPIKYEIDKDTDTIWIDRFVATAMFYPVNYGYIPQTLSEDGDPIDALITTPFKLGPGVIIRSRPVGILYMEDESGIDYKIMCVPHDKLTTLYKDVKDIENVNELLLKQISHYFENYKGLEDGKWAKVKNWDNKLAAIKEIEKSIQAYSNTK